MASPQKENGYTPIANELLEKLYFAPLNGSELKICLMVIRKTYGYGKKEDWISLSQFSKEISLPRQNVCRVLKKLVANKLLLKTEMRLKLNKNYDEWLVAKKRPSRQRGNEVVANEAIRVVANRRHTKDNITKEIITKERTPAQKMKDFLKNPESAIQALITKGVNEHLAREEIKKFISYWSELNKSGTKQRWEKQETFEVGRRLATWFNNIKAFNKPNNKIIDIPE